MKMIGYKCGELNCEKVCASQAQFIGEMIMDICSKCQEIARLEREMTRLQEDNKRLKGLLEIATNKDAFKPIEGVPYETACKKCGGFIGKPGVAYGYAGQWCTCNWKS